MSFQGFREDCFDVLPCLPDGVADMVLTDLPYGTTSCKWDSVLPLYELWVELCRVTKPEGAMVFTSAQPFTTTLIASNMGRFRYCWYWNKTVPTNFANAKRQPMRCIEDIVIFYRKTPTYNPQGLVRVDKPMHNTSHSRGGDTMRGDTDDDRDKGALRTKGHKYVQEFTNYPKQLLTFGPDRPSLHPTQKPVALFEYLINTYTNPLDIVLDPCAGVLTTGVAAFNTGRNSICIEKDAGYFEKGLGRMAK